MYYEETSTGYKATTYEKSDITAEKVASWLTACGKSEGYYQYIYSDPDSWDMFIYYSPDVGRISSNGFKFSVVDSVVKVYVTNDGSTGAHADFILIRIQAPLRGAWPSTSELYVDDRKIDMQGSDFSV